MAVKGIKFSEVKAKALANPDVKKAYDEATQEPRLQHAWELANQLSAVLRGMYQVPALQRYNVMLQLVVCTLSCLFNKIDTLG